VKRRPWVGWGCLGLAGSALIALAGPGLMRGAGVDWWFAPDLPGGNSIWLYVGMGALAVAWLGLGRDWRGLGRDSRGLGRDSRGPGRDSRGLGRDSRGPGRDSSLHRLWLIAAAWCLPLLVAPALFSRDVYSYLAQGTILHLGLSPYQHAPAVLGHGPVLGAVDPFWRHTTAPYGPVFLGLVSLVAGASPTFAVVVLRLLEVAGVGLLALCTPRLARALGADGGRAVWLVALSPLVLLELIVPAHNDALMAGLLLAGVTLAIERRPLAGIVVCAVAATIKLPAAAAIPFIAVAWARTQVGVGARVAVLARALAAVVVVALLVSAIPGVGFGWLSSSLFATPQKVRLAITPATGLGWTAAALLRDLGVGVSARHLEAVLGAMAFAMVGVAAVVLLARARFATLPRDLGWLLVAAAFCGPAAWPWYFAWGLVLLACCPATQRARGLPLLLAAAPFLVKANGVLALPLESAPAVLAVYAAAAWYLLRGARLRARERLPDLALVEPG
jgi:hypothetical protein